MDFGGALPKILICEADSNSKNQYWKFETNILRKGIARHSPNFHIHVSVSDLYIPKIDLLQDICGPILGIYKLLTDKWMWKLGQFPEKENINGIFIAVREE